MKTSEIPTKPILEFLLSHKGGKWCNWIFRDERDVTQVFPENVKEKDKLVLSKMKKLILKGLVEGCFCGCRGDFIITEKGEKWLTLN